MGISEDSVAAKRETVATDSLLEMRDNECGIVCGKKWLHLADDAQGASQL